MYIDKNVIKYKRRFKRLSVEEQIKHISRARVVRNRIINEDKDDWWFNRQSWYMIKWYIKTKNIKLNTQ